MQDIHVRHALEKLTGVSYRSYVAENIFKRAGMDDTAFCAMDEINENAAEGYYSVRKENCEFAGYKKNIYRFPPIGSPDGGAYSTADDLNKFIRAIKNNILLCKTYSELLLLPHCKFTRPSLWKAAGKCVIRTGYAFEFLEIDGETFCVFKDGCSEGVSAILSYYPKADITLTLLSNQDCNVWKMHRLMQTEIYNTFYR
jgi:CubicO group peptidase (beta-lactamase class C family)